MKFYNPDVPSAYWLYVIQLLAGSTHALTWHDEEEMKLLATAGRESNTEPHPGSSRFPYWMLHAAAHFSRARGVLDRWCAEQYEQEFPDGFPFRRYLGAWLWSVGIPKLQMTAADLEAAYEATGVAPLPHPLMPPGRSYPCGKTIRTTEVEKIPAKDLAAGTLAAAMAASESK